MYRRKQYGASQTPTCVFCGSSAYAKNTQGFVACADHKHAQVGACKCSCGEWLNELDGKYGKFFACPQCGTLNISKVKSLNPKSFVAQKKEEKKTPQRSIYGNKKNVVIKSTDLDWYL